MTPGELVKIEMLQTLQEFQMRKGEQHLVLPPSPPRLVSDIRRGPRETGLQDLGTVWLGRAPRNQASLKSTCILLKGQETQCPILDTATRIGANDKNVFRRVQATPAEDSTLHTHLKH